MGKTNTEEPVKALVVTRNDAKISAAFGGYSPEEVAIIKSSVAKGCTDTELAYFLNVAKSVGLNPFRKEVWCFKDQKGNMLVFAGRDGFLSAAQKNAKFGGMRSSEVKEKDKFSVNVAKGEVNHEITTLGDRGKLLGAYCIVFRKGGEPTIEIVEFNRYDKGYNTWKTHPEEMIKKVAECHALKKAFGLVGIQAEDDFRIEHGTVSAGSVDTTAQNALLSNTQKK